MIKGSGMEINKLRGIAKLNFCKECYAKYTAFIEPNIRPLSQPLPDWRGAESTLTQLVMKHKGVFKGDVIFIAIDNDMDEKWPGQVDVIAFKEIKKWSLKRKLDYLRRHGILQNASYAFLNKVREIRNKIHEEFYDFSEEDMTLFRYARFITDQISGAILYDMPETFSATMTSNAEKMAEQLLS